MKVLLNACVWKGAKEDLTNQGHDVVWAGDWSEDPGDEEILDRARSEDRVLDRRARTNAGARSLTTSRFPFLLPFPIAAGAVAWLVFS